MNSKQSEFIKQLYLEMFAMMLKYATSNLQNESIAEEAVQETFRIACLKPEALCDSPNPRGWLMVTLKQTMRNIQRSHQSTEKLLSLYTTMHGDELLQTEDKLDLHLLYDDIAGTEDFKLLKEMVVDGKSHLELAKARGIGVDACKKRVQRAKENLRKKMKI